METMMMILPAVLKLLVMPVESPTVPKAETSSKMRSRRERPSIARISVSVMLNRKIQIKFPTTKKTKTE